MTPEQRYQQDLAAEKIHFDVAQQNAVQSLQRVYRDITRWSLWPRATKGLYLWGDVGRGKTYLMDLFYESLTIQKKQRTHFLSFMRDVQDQLKKIKHEQNPLKKIAKQIAKEVDVLCFDEFVVKDVADAMILGKLLGYLFQLKVALVTTSNIIPDGLYKGGVSRDRFLPTIALLKKHCEILHVDNHIDYRIQGAMLEGNYFYPLTSEVTEHMRKRFDDLVVSNVIENQKIMIEGREINTVKYSKSIVWFDFKDICGVPRSQRDYLALVKQYHTLFISDVPMIQKNQTDYAQNFIHLIDVVYDAGAQLIISSQTSIDNIYTKGRLLFDFKRTCSRLKEMQTQAYISL